METENVNVKGILTIEMVVRIVKKLIQDESRRQMQLIRVPTQGPFVQIIVKSINQLLTNDGGLWGHIIDRLESKFDVPPEHSNQIKQGIKIIPLIQVIFLFPQSSPLSFILF